MISPHRSRSKLRLFSTAAIAGLMAITTACSSSSTGSGSSVAVSPAGLVAGSPASGSSASAAAGSLRLGYFANVTHAAAVLGVADGTFQKNLGSTQLQTSIFNAGPAAIEALNAGSIDAAFLGPSTAINAFVKSGGASLRIVAGATDNGVSLVVKPGITSAADLRGKSIADPQLGGTQDVSLREYLFKNGLKTQTNGGSDVDVVNQDNSQTLTLFKTGQVDGGWLPEPWASRLVVEGGGKTLVNEATLWPGGHFPSTVLIVSKSYLDAHPDAVKGLITGELAALAEIAKDPAGSEAAINAAIGKLTNSKLSTAVITLAFKNIVPTDDPEASTYNTSSQHAVDGGLLKSLPQLDGIVDLRILNSILTSQGKKTVSAAGLGQE